MNEVDSKYLKELSRLNKYLSTIENQNDFERGFFPRLTLHEAKQIPLSRLQVLRGKTYVERVGNLASTKTNIYSVTSQKEWYPRDLEYRYRNESGKRGEFYAQAKLDDFIDSFRDAWVSRYVEKIVTKFQNENGLRATIKKIEIAFNEGIITQEVLDYRSKHMSEPQSNSMQKFLTDFAVLFRANKETFNEENRNESE